MKHTPEPWAVGSDRIYSEAADGSDVALLMQPGSRPNGEREANAARIVACVNACEGMDDPAAEIARLRESLHDAYALLADIRTSFPARFSAEGQSFLARLRDQIAAYEGRDAEEIQDGALERTVHALHRKHGRAV